MLGMVFGVHGSRSKPGRLEVEGLPSRILTEYNLNPHSWEKNSATWRITSDQGGVIIGLYDGDSGRLDTVLRWQESSALQGSAAVCLPLKTRAGKHTAVWEKSVYYALAKPDGEVFKPGNKNNLLVCAQELGIVHHLTRDFLAEEPFSFDWPKLIQERLTDLLTYSHWLKRKRAQTDFEHLYLESLDFFYNQGQEAIQHMVLATVGGEMDHRQALLINTFLRQTLLPADEKVYFLDLTRWTKGPRMMDLALFLNSYMPLHQWNLALLLDIMQQYQRDEGLNHQEKHLLVALLRFPSRFWLYARQYFCGDRTPHELAEKLKNYRYECCERDKCLDLFEEQLWKE